MFAVFAANIIKMYDQVSTFIFTGFNELTLTRL